MRNHRQFVFLFLLAFVCIRAFGQDVLLDPVRIYQAAAGNRAVIYHGKEQLKYSQRLLNHPYFVDEKYETGELSFEGVLYTDMSLRLDLHRSELLILTDDQRFNIVLPNDRVDYARFHGYHIFYHYPDSAKGSPPEGYYLRLHDGGLRVLERQRYELQQVTSNLTIEDKFVLSVKYYIYKDGVYTAVKSKGSVLKVLRDRKAELARFIRQRALNFKKAPEEAIVEVVREYERLKGKP